MGDFLKTLFGRTLAWLAALGVGGAYALLQGVQDYFSHAAPAPGGSPVEVLVQSAIIAGLVKLVGAIISHNFPPKV